MTTNRYKYLFACVSLCMINCVPLLAQSVSSKQYAINAPSGENRITAGFRSNSLELIDRNAATFNQSNDIIRQSVNESSNTALAVDPISGPAGGCVGTTITLTHTISGGVWFSSNTSIATVNASTGVVSIVGAGSATIFYGGFDGFIPFLVSKTITTASVVMHPDVIECNNGITSFNATDSYYGVTYSNSNAGNSYLWSVTSTGSYSYQGSSSATSQYPRMQLSSSAAYTVIVKFTTGGVSCSDTQIVYKNASSSAAINNAHDTTVCYNATNVPLSGTVSSVTNSYSWSTNGTGSFSSTNALSTTYTPSAADKALGQIKIYFTGYSTYNATGNCGSSLSKDSMILRIYPNNTGTDSTRVICSGQILNYTPLSVQSGSTFTWTSAFTTGSGSGNTAVGSGTISNTLINSSNTTAAVVTYTITPFYAGCAGTPFTLTATINPNPAITITNNSNMLCSATTTNIQMGSSLSGSKYTWTSSVISGTSSGQSNNATPGTNNTITDILTNNGSTNALVRYKITTISTAGCSAIDSTDITVKPKPSTANAGADQAVCNVSSTVLNANVPTVGTGSWSQLSGPSTATFSNNSNPTATASGLVPGTYVFTWSIANSPCNSSIDTVMIINSPQTVAGTLSSNATVCYGTNAGTLTLSGYTGSIIRWEASTDGGSTWPTIIANTSSTYAYSNLTTTTTYRAVVQSGNCSIQYSNSITITVDPLTVPGTLTGAATVCAGSNTGNLTLSGYTGSIIRWEASTDGGITWPNTFPINTSNYTYNNLSVTTQYRAVIQSGTCSVAYSNAITITVNPATVAGTLANNATVCAGTNNGNLSLTGQTGNIVDWEYSINNGSNWTSLGNTNTSYTYNNLTTTTYYRVLVKSGVCGSVYSNNAIISVVQPVVVPNAGADMAVCNVAATSLNAVTPSSGTGVWSVLSGAPSSISFNNASDPTTTVNGLVPGTYQFEWTVSNGVCANLKDTVQLIVYPATVAGTVSAGTTVCANNNTGSLTLSGYTGNILRWESSIDNGATWTNLSNTSNIQAYNNLATTTKYRALVQNGNCTALYSSISTITVLQAVTNANAGADTAVCNVTATSLHANTPTSGTGNWTAIAGGPSTVSFTNPADPNTTVNGLVPGTYQFVWTISNGTCVDSKDTVALTVSPATVPGTIAADATVCATANSGILTLSGYTSTILNWEFSINNGTSWNTITNTTNTQAYNNLSTTTKYRASVQSGVCAAQYSNIATVTVIPPASTANAGADTTVCNVTATALHANTPTSGTGTWTAIAGGPSTVSFTNPADPNTTVNGLVPGTYQFVWTISNGTCVDSKDTVALTVSPATVPGTIAADATVCATVNSGTLTLSGYTSTILNWEFSINNGTSWNTITNTTNTQAYNNLSTTTKYRASVRSGVCAAQYSNIATVTVIPPASTANAGADTTVCNVTATALHANTPTSGTGNWTAIAGGPSTVSFTNPADPNTTVNGLVAGTYQFVWTISNSTCVDSKDTLALTVSPATVPGAIAADATVCATANSGTLTLSGYTSTILNWEFSINNGTSWNTITNTTNTQAYNNLTTTTKYRASVQSGVCAAQYSNIATVTVIPPASTANAGADTTVCNVTATSLHANTPTSGTGTWTAIAGGPSTVSFTNPADPNTTVNGLVAGTYQFVWTISNGTCLDSKDTVALTVSPATVPGTIAADATVCATANSGTLTLSGYTGNIVRWESSTDNGSSWSPITNTTNTLNYNNLSASTQYRASVKNLVCPALYSNIGVITVLQPVTAANAGPDTTFINGVSSYTLGGNTPTSGTGTWSVVPGATSTLNFSSLNNPKATITGLDYVHGTPPTDGKYLLVWTISNGYCAVSRDTMQITVQPPTNPGVIGPDAVVCTGNNHGVLRLTDYLGTILQWESSTDNGNTWDTITATIGTNQDTLVYDNLTTTTLFRALVKNGVGAELYSGIAATVTVLQLVTPSNAGADQVLCNRTSTILAGNTPTSGMGTWTALAGSPTTPSFSNNADPNSVVSGLTIGTYQFVWTISNGLCSDSQDTVIITIQPPTVAGTIAASNTVCVTSNVGTLNLTGFTGNVVQSEYSTDNGTTWNMLTGSANQTSYTYNNLLTTTQFRTQVQNGVCPSLYTNIVTVTVLPEVTPSNAGTDQAICNVTSATLAANTPTSGTGMWTVIPGAPSTVNFTNPADANTTVNGLIAGTYQFVWTISNALCADSKDTVQIIVHPPTVAGNIVADATVCATANGNTITLSGNTGDVLRWEFSIDNGASWNNISNTTNSLNYLNLNTTTAYQALVQNAICPALYTNKVTITVVQPVTIANAGTDQALCNVTSATLAANTPSSGTGMWTVVPGAPSTVNFTNPADANTTVNGLVPGTYQFVWTISNALCADSKDTVQIIVHPPTVAGNIVADATVCATANGNTITLSGNTGDILRWEFSIDNGASWNNISNTTNSLNYLNLNTTTAYQALVQNAICPALYTNKVTITVVQPVTTANAGADQALCNVTSATLAANTPSSGTGMWTVVPGAPSTVNFTNPADANTTVNGLVPGTYQFVWTISNALCADSKDTVQIIVHPPTVAGNILASATVCATANGNTITLSGNTGDILRWEFSIDNGASWNNISNTTNSLNYLNLNTTTAYQALVQNAICPALYTNKVTITVVQPVTTANAGADQALCNVTSATLAANTPTSGTGMWTVVPGAPSTVNFTNPADANTTVNGLTAGTYQFVWTISNSICASSSDTIQISIAPATVAGTLIADATVCYANNSNTLQLTGYTGSIVKWESSLDNGSSWNALTDTSNTLSYTNLTATTTYRILVKSGVCTGLYSNPVTITVLQPVTIANAGTDQRLCNAPKATLNANKPVVGTGKWTVISGPSTLVFANDEDPNTVVNGLTIGTYQLVWTISHTMCEATRDTVNITIDPVTVPGTLSSNALVCANANTGTLTLTGNTGAILHWEYSIDNGSSWTIVSDTSNSYIYNNLTTSTIYRVLVQNSVCAASYSNNILATVLQPVSPSNAGANQILCNSNVVRLNGNTPTSGSGIWALVSGPSGANISNINLANTNVTGLTSGTYQFMWLISNGVCAISSSVTTVTINPLTAPGTLEKNDSVCTGTNSGTLTLKNHTGSIIRWEYSTDNGNNWSVINDTTNVYTYQNLSATTLYRALVQSGVCTAEYSNTVSIDVSPLSAKGKLVMVDTVCISGNNGTLLLSDYTGSVYHWEYSENNGQQWNILSNNTNNHTYTNLTKSTLYRVWIKSGVCAGIYSDSIRITVDEATIGGKLNGADTVCYGNNMGTVRLNGRLGSVMHWEMLESNSGTWTIINNTSDTLLYQNLQNSVTYRALVQNGACAVAYSDSANITVLPPVTVANAGTDIIVCNGNSSTTLNANKAISGIGSWEWISGPNKIQFSDIHAPNAMISGLVPGTYTICWNITNGKCASTCDTLIIKVDKTIADFKLSATQYCGKTTYHFTDLSTSNFGISSWKWSINPGDSIAVQNPSIDFTSEGTYNASLTVQSGTGCVNNLLAQFNVMIYEFPKVDINAIRDICKNQLIQVSPNVNSKDSIARLLWNLGNGSRSADSVVSVRYLVDGNYTVKLTVSTVNNCFDSAYKQITVHPSPIIDITNNTTICKGDSVLLRASGATSYVWSDQFDNNLCSNCATRTVKPISSSTYRVIGYSEYGCSEIKTTSVRVIQPLRMVAAKGDTLCVGSSKQLFATGAAKYRWYPEKGLDNPLIANPKAKPDATTTYHVIGKDDNNCFTDTIPVQLVVGLPTAINIGKDTAIAAGTVLQFKAVPLVTANNAGDIRQWRWGGVSSISCFNCPNPDIKISNDAFITCTIVNSFGCTSTDTVCVKTFCPSTELFVPNAFSPDGDGINDKLVLQGKGIRLIKSFRIFSRWGELVFEKTNFLPGDAANAWDGTINGKPAPSDVFVYISEVICEKGLPTSFKGNITILK